MKKNEQLPENLLAKAQKNHLRSCNFLLPNDKPHINIEKQHPSGVWEILQHSEQTLYTNSSLYHLYLSNGAVIFNLAKPLSYKFLLKICQDLNEGYTTRNIGIYSI